MALSLTRPYETDSQTDAARLVGRLTAVFALAAGVIHFSAAGDHTNLPVMLAGFVVVGVLQVGLGVLLLVRRPGAVVIAAGVALMAGAIAVWVVSRTSGLPFLERGHMEQVGFKDGVCVLFEIGAISGLLLLLSRDLSFVEVPRRLPSRAMGTVAAASFALMVPALMLEGGSHHTHDEAVELGIHGHDGDSAAHAGDGDHGHGGAKKSRAHRRSGHGHAGRDDAGGARRGHSRLASFHPTHGDDPAGGDHASHEEAASREHPTRHRDRDTHRGHDRDRGHGRGEHPHGKHSGDKGGGDEGSSPDDGLTVEDVPAVCAVSSVVTDICR